MKPRRASNADANARRLKRRRLARRAALALVVLLALLAAVTLTPLAGLWLRPLVGPRLGGVRIEGGSMRFTLGGDLIVAGAAVIIEPAPGADLRGEAARFLRIEQARIGLSLMAPLTGKDFIHDITVSDADILVVKPVDGYNINLLQIFTAGPPTDGPLRAPGVDLRRATLTLGEYDDSGAVTPLRTMRITAGVRREGQSRYSFWLREIDEGASADVSLPARLEGAIDGATPGASMFSGTLAGIDLADWPPSAIPAQLREDYTRFAPVGGLHKASFVYDERAGAFRLSLDLTPDGADHAASDGETADGVAAARAPVRFTMPLGSREDDDPDMIVPVEAGGRVRITWRDERATWAQAGAAEAPGPGDHRWNLAADLHGALLGAPASVDIDYWFGATGEKAYYTVEAASDGPIPLDPDRWAGRVPDEILDEVRRYQIDGAGDLWVRAARTGATPEFVEAGLHIHDTRAVYHHFRYPIEDASGDIIFRDGNVSVTVDGRTPSGAPVALRGKVGIGNRITMDATLSARGVPYDQTMIDALNDRSRRIVELMLYEGGLDQWLGAGLLDEPFALGGLADFDLHLTLDTRESDEVGAAIDIHVDRLGLRNRYFPMPVIGRNVHIRAVKELRHTEPDGTERPESLVIRPVSGEFTTLAGGRLDPMASVVRIPTEHVERLEAEVRVEAADIAITDLLVASIPGSDAAPADPDRPDLNGRSIARRLRPEGRIDGVATIRRPPGGPTAVRIGVEVDGAAHPPPPTALEGAGPLTIADLTGSVNITRETVQVDLRGRPDGAGWMAAKVHVPFADPKRASVSAEALAVDPARPLENLVNVFRPAEARRLAEFKASAQPAGLIDVTMTMGAGQGADPAPLRIEITNLVEPQMNFLGGRLSARNLGGRLILDQADPGVITLDSIEGAFNFDGQPLGRLTVSGGRALEAGRHAPLRVDFDDARIESPLLAHQIERVGGEVAGWQWRQAAPAGLASGWLTFDTTVTEDGPEATVSALRIEPHMLSWMRNGARAQPQRISGVIAGDTTSGALAGTVDQLEFSADRYSARASGPWTITEGRGLGATLALDAHLDPPPPHESHESLESREFHEDAPGEFEPPANIIPPDVRALLPAPALEAIEALTLQIGGRATLTNATWRFRGGAAADGAGSAENAPAFEGRVQLETAAGGLDQQIQVAGVQAWVTVQPAPLPPAELPRIGTEAEIEVEPLGPLEMLIQFDEGVIWGLPVSGGRAVIVSDVPGLVRAPMISADSAAGGRITAHGEAQRRAEQWTYKARLISSALPVASMSRAIRSVIGRDGQAPEAMARTHGVLDLGMGIEGVFGDVRARRGSGSLRISGGSPVNLPPALRLLVSTANARLASAPYDHVEADFFFEGDLVAFPTISMSSRDIVIAGYGFMSLADGAVELVARSEPRGRQLGGGEIFRGVRDLFFTTYVGGTVDDPQALNIPPRDRLPAPLSQILRHIEGGLTEREWLMRQLREHAVSEPDPRHRR